jgi:hypothetical protein
VEVRKAGSIGVWRGKGKGVVEREGERCVGKGKGVWWRGKGKGVVEREGEGRREGERCVVERGGEWWGSTTLNFPCASPARACAITQRS